jgi:predicted ATP-grasp superfamily ATP-dependent carboligase
MKHFLKHWATGLRNDLLNQLLKENMTHSQNPNSKIRILLSEGSSTNVREMITALGQAGYTMDICDPNPLCMGRFSRYIRRVYRCPTSGSDPVGYLKFIIRLLKQQAYDVLFPANEQAYLFAWAKDYLTPLVGLAVADFSAFNRLQTKAAFMQLLDEIGLPHPLTRIAHTWPEIEEAAAFFTAPCYLKTSYGTASTGVWRIEREPALPEIKARLSEQQLLDGQTEFLVQAAAVGKFEQSHAIFDRGHLLALHCTRRLLEGAQGGATLKMGVNRPLVRQHFEAIGRHLAWHGSLSIDYFWDEQTGQPAYIDANPRITEPMNAVVNGINLADLQVQLSLGREISAFPPIQTALKSHNAIQAVLGAAGRRRSRLDVLREMGRVVLKKGIYRDSREGMTPVWQDAPSLLPLAVVLTGLLLDPRSEQQLTLKTIANYSLGAAIPRLLTMEPEAFL